MLILCGLFRPVKFPLPTAIAMMARDLAHRPDEVPRICRMLDLVAHGAAGHGPVLISAAEIGLAWDGDESGWIRAALHPRRMLSGSIQHFQRAPFEAWQLKVCAQLADRKVFFAVRSSWISEDLYNCFLPPAEKR